MNLILGLGKPPVMTLCISTEVINDQHKVCHSKISLAVGDGNALFVVPSIFYNDNYCCCDHLVNPRMNFQWSVANIMIYCKSYTIYCYNSSEGYGKFPRELPWLECSVSYTKNRQIYGKILSELPWLEHTVLNTNQGAEVWSVSIRITMVGAEVW